MENIEDKIRDKLVHKLDIIDDNLELIKKENFLPNQQGTNGFIDILAKDSQGRYVIIELKRSKASSREALHEILKYIEGLKQNKSLKDDEIRVIIISTEWEELLVPFSSFIKTIKIKVDGYLLEVDEQLNPKSAKIVEPLKLNNDRLLSDIHSMHLYKNNDNLQKGILSHKDVLNKKNIEDYVLVILKGNPLNEYNTPDNIFWNDFIIYKVIQVLDEEHYYKIIRTDQSLFKELEEIKESYEDNELLKLLHTYAIDNVKPFPYSDDVEIGYPAKFSNKLLEEEKWEIQEIIRSGRFLNNSLLTDKILIQEISGSSGTNNQIYYKNFSPNNISSIDEISKAISTCLLHNKIWEQGLLYAIQQIKKTKFSEISNGLIHIYNPSNTIFSIYKVMSSDNFTEWIPNYNMVIEDESSARIYFGCLIANENKSTLKDIIDKYYDGDIFQLLLLMTSGGYESRDEEISSFLGLEYTNFYIEIDTKTNKESVFKFNGFKYIPIKDEDIQIYNEFNIFIENNIEVVSEIVHLYDTHYCSIK